MHDIANSLGFPLWLRISHFINIACMLFLMRSGLQILADHPKLYWNDHAIPGSEWIKFGRRKIPRDRAWTSMDEVEKINPIVALPGGRHNLGTARRWHFFVALLWTITGLAYAILLFATGEWRRLVPTSWSIFPAAWHTLVDYLNLQSPPASAFHPYDPLQQLTYFGVIFILAPLMIVTGVAMSPAVAARFPWYIKLFGGRQGARSLHFLGFAALALFSVMHPVLVAIVHFPQNIREITLGSPFTSLATAVAIASVALLFIFLLNVWATVFTLRRQRRWQLLIDRVMDPIIRRVFGHLRSRQRYTKADISPYFRINGLPPTTEEFRELAAGDFRQWRLQINGLVGAPQKLSLAELRKLPKEEHITKHNCIQGWSAIAQWAGVPWRVVVARCRPSADARYVVFYGYDTDEQGKPYYTTFRLDELDDPQTLLAYEMNGVLLPAEHGAPLRLRIETRLGYKMVKYLRAIEFVADLKNVGEGYGGYREDTQYYEKVAAI